MEHDKTGCQFPPEAPVLCVNNCGFFGSAATMNMCSKCHKDLILTQQEAKFVESSFGNIGGASAENIKGFIPIISLNVQAGSARRTTCALAPNASGEEKAKNGPIRCSSCRKRVGLTGFNCRCGQIFCSTHRYSDKHVCSFDYRNAARDAISKANPVIKGEKLDKI